MKKVSIGNIGASGCPCGTFKGKGFRIDTHCWRVGLCCSFSGVHYSFSVGKKEAAIKKAKEIADYIKENWGTDVEIRGEKRENL